MNTTNRNINKKFVEISDLAINQRLGIFTAVKGCGSNEAAKLNQVKIVKYIVGCLVKDKTAIKFENKSYFGFSESAPEFGKIFRVH